MNRQQKSSLIQWLSEKFTTSNVFFIVNCQGLTVSQMQALRLALDAKNSEMQVIKNRIVRIAIKENPDCKSLNSKLVGQNAIVFANADLTGTAKVLYDFAKSNEELKVVAGFYDSHLIDKDAVGVLARLPSRNILLSQLVGTIKAPITSLVVVLQQIVEKMQGEKSQIEINKENL